MDNARMRELKEQMDVIDYKIAHKTGVTYDTIVDFFKGKRDELDPSDRKKIEAVLIQEAKKNKIRV